MGNLKGIAASNGIAIAKAYRLVEPDLSFEKRTVADIEQEVRRFQSALAESRRELEAIREKANAELGADKATIFEAHLLIANDPELLAPIEDKIKIDQVNAEQALKEVADMFISMFEQMDNDYMKERAADIRDVTKRIMSHLLGVHIANPGMIAEETVIVAEDLTPSDTAQLNRQFVKGFTTNIGGRTSHSAIMARSMEIPAVVGTKAATEEIKHGDLIIVDGFRGEVFINPAPDVIARYREEQIRYQAQKAEWAKLVNEETVTADGDHVELGANIGSPNDVEAAKQNGAEAVGLFRTEFLYMGRTEMPSEEEQFEAYKAVLEGMAGKPVVV